MQAFREIRDVTSDTITIALPAALRNQRVEIIVLPLEDNPNQQEAKDWADGFFENIAGSLPDFPEIESEGNYETRTPLA